MLTAPVDGEGAADPDELDALPGRARGGHALSDDVERAALVDVDRLAHAGDDDVGDRQRADVPPSSAMPTPRRCCPIVEAADRVALGERVDAVAAALTTMIGAVPAGSIVTGCCRRRVGVMARPSPSPISVWSLSRLMPSASV